MDTRELPLDHEAVRRMAHFVPTSSTKNLPVEALEYIVLHTMANSDLDALTATEVRDKAVELFHIGFDLDEIRTCLSGLTAAKRVQWDELNSFSISYREKTKLRSLAAESLELEKHVMAEWLDEVRLALPTEEISADDAQKLCDDLARYVSLVYHIHGADCVAFLIRDPALGEKVFSIDEDTLSAHLPDRDERLTRIRACALPLFLRNGHIKRKEYLAGLLCSSFALLMLNCDRHRATHWRNNWQGTVFYLDTNFLLRLLNIEGDSNYRAALRLLELCHLAGVRLKVTKVTLKELRDVCHYWKMQLESRRPPSRDLAGLVRRTPLGVDGIVSAYYEHIASGGIHDDFLARFSVVERQLQGYKVVVDGSDYLRQFAADPIFAEYALELMDGLKKPIELAEHDALHRLLVERKRGEQISDPLQAKAWFLTCDSHLASYEHVRALKKGDVPTVLSASTWMQLVRPILGRKVDDYDATFLNMVTSPFLRAFDGVPPLTALEVVHRIQKYQNVPPDVAFTILQNEHLVQSIGRASPDEEEKIIRLEIAEALRAARDSAKAQETRSQEVIEKTKSAAQAAVTQQAALVQQREAELEELSDRYREVTSALDEANARAATVQAKLDRMESSSLRRRAWIRRSVGLLLWTATTFFAVLYPWSTVEQWMKALAVIAFCICYLCYTLLIVGRKAIMSGEWLASRFQAVVYLALGIGSVLLSVSRVLEWQDFWAMIGAGGTGVGILIAVVSTKPSSTDS